MLAKRVDADSTTQDGKGVTGNSGRMQGACGMALTIDSANRPARDLNAGNEIFSRVINSSQTALQCGAARSFPNDCSRDIASKTAWL